MTEAQPQGIWVLYGTPQSGKSTAATHALHNLAVQGKIKVLELSGGTFSPYLLHVANQTHHDAARSFTIPGWLQFVHCSTPYSPRLFTLSAILNPETRGTGPRPVLLIDTFDSVVDISAINHLRATMRDIANDIADSGQFTLLLLTARKETCEEIMTWNNGRKFKGVVKDGFAWTPAELRAAVAHYRSIGVIAASATNDQLAALDSAIESIESIRHLREYITDHLPSNAEAIATQKVDF
eukprot:m.5366 g.5366  ORF g.5366 m.5366 type:complete len:239 (-) comp1999_c0_seq1:89-805(-)